MTMRDGGDSSIARLAREAGSEEAVDRSKWIAFSIIVLGGLGAIASAMRPVIRQYYAARAPARSAAAVVSAPSASVSAVHTAKLDELLTRLRLLQSQHQERHPLWYGRPTPSLIADMQAIIEAKNKEPEQSLR